LDKTILFDTGGDGGVLLANMRRLGVKPGEIEVVVLSHVHGDHVGGLAAVLKEVKGLEVFVPASFPDSFKKRVREAGSRVQDVDAVCQVCKGAHSTGQVASRGLSEQALVVQTATGAVVVTGCAHPGVVRMVEAAGRASKRIHGVLGGFHMGGSSAAKIQDVIDTFRRMGLELIGPLHCSGDQTRAMMRQAFGRQCWNAGVGARIRLPAKTDGQ
jgi:7,8-dihydropterin-6-yl-methyl-4-(beta-D-ribofuranosyl)aminobenzene 5'-phosphate synthase